MASYLSSSEISSLFEMLGNEIVLLDCGAIGKRKGPIRKGYPKFTTAIMTDSYLKGLESRQIGVLTGPASNWLGGIDIDDDQVLEPFLKRNPRFATTARIRGRKGAKFFFRCSSTDAPAERGSRVLRLQGRDVGEILWNKNAIVHGIHPDTGNPYVWEHSGPVISIGISEIDLSLFEFAKPRPPLLGGEGERGSSKSVSLCPMYLSGNLSLSGGVIENQAIRDAFEAESRVKELLKEEETRFAELWRSLVWEKWDPAPATRNEWIKQSVPFLRRVGGRNFVMKCSELFYRAAGFFKESLSAHLSKTEIMITNVETTIAQELSELETRICTELDDRHRDAFLILRDCAGRKSDGIFPMSCKELRIRMSLADNKTADRILRTLMRLRIIELVERGEQYRLGSRPKATTWRWLVPREKTDIS